MKVMKIVSCYRMIIMAHFKKQRSNFLKVWDVKCGVLNEQMILCFAYIHELD